MRKKLLNSLNHKSGKIPFDLGSTAVTGMHVTCVEAMREYYGLEKRPVKVYEPYHRCLGILKMTYGPLITGK